MDDETVLLGMRERVRIGAPIDSVLGRPGKDLEGAPAVAIDGRKRRRMYTWGTPECDEAFREGRLERARVPGPLKAARLTLVEPILHAPLPRLLARILTEIGNGGMGPGYGILGIGKRGHQTDLGQDGVNIAEQLVAGDWGSAPEGAYPLCHWGCGIMSFVTPDGQVWGWDPNPIDPDADVPFFLEDCGLREWLQSWLEGSLVQPWAIADGGTWRGATAEEKRLALAEDEA